MSHSSATEKHGWDYLSERKSDLDTQGGKQSLHGQELTPLEKALIEDESCIYPQSLDPRSLETIRARAIVSTPTSSYVPSPMTSRDLAGLSALMSSRQSNDHQLAVNRALKETGTYPFQPSGTKLGTLVDTLARERLEQSTNSEGRNGSVTSASSASGATDDRE